MRINNEFLREIRKEKKLTQKEIAKLLNLDRTSISRYESGVHNPSLKVIGLYAEFFSVSVEKFFKKD